MTYRGGYTYRYTIRSTAGMIFGLLALLACQSALAAASKRVLVLHSFSREVKPWKEMSAEIHAELSRQSPWPLDIIDRSIVTARNEYDKSEALFVDYLGALFEKEPLDLIVSIGAPAAVFVQRHREKLFAATPMVLAALEQRRIQPSILTENDAVAGVAADFPAIIENILRVLPDTKTIAVVMGDSPNERYWLEVLRKEYAQFADRVSFVWLNNMSFADILKQAAALPPHSAIFFFLMNVDAAGISYEGDTAMRSLSAVANAPIFTHDDTYFLDGGIVGGPMHSYINTSRHAVAVAMRILGGEKPGEIRAPPVRFAAPKFDWRQLQRWGISESRLPPGSQIYFREPGAWEQYRLQLMAILAFMLLQTALISWLFYEHRRRSVAEVKSRSALAELANMNRLATAGQLSASIAHEINQPVTGIVLMASAALRWLPADRPEMDRIRSLLSDIVGAGQQAGDIIKGVRAMFKKEDGAKGPVNLNNLINTVLALLRLDLQKDDVRVETQLDEQLPSVSGSAVQLQQVILNLIVNAADAMRTVQPRILRVRTSRSPSGMVHVSIEDTGTGIRAPDRSRIFDPLFTTKAGGMGMGLSICRSIIENHAGRIWVSPGVKGGSIFQFELPSKSDKVSVGAMAV
jgi:signal transduction histidine kinase